jgi:uncharacterized protein YndB with AHSA1/START domain
MNRRLPSIDLTFHLQSSPSEVFRALSNSETLVKWWPTKASVSSEEKRFSLIFDNGFEIDGEISNFKKNKSISFSWVEGISSFTLSSKKDGTLLKLHHDGFESHEALARSSSGWSYYLTNMKSVLDHGTDLRSKDDSF